MLIGCAALIALYAWAVRFRFSQRAAAWLTGVLLLFLALVSPLDALADKYLFSVHMAKHILFVLVIPALLLIGLPAGPLDRLLRKRRVAVTERFLRLPVVAWSAGVGAMALWHIPFVFNEASSHAPVHIVEHLSLLAGGTVFWWPILAPRLDSRMPPVPQGAAYLFTACLACTSIGVVITFAPNLLYSTYSHPVDTYGILPMIRDRWGISAAMDQQIGGLLMWVPACLVYLTAIMAMFARWYGEEPAPPLEQPSEPRWT